MKPVAFSSAITLLLFTASHCNADSLVITYRSGKTQTVVLDEPSQGVSSWQFVGGLAQQQQLNHSSTVLLQSETEQVQKDLTSQGTVDNKLTEKAPVTKAGIRVKLNARPLPD